MSECGLIGAPDEIRRRLALPGAPPKRPGRAPASGGKVHQSLAEVTELVPIDELRPWPDNPRHADEVALAQSLSRNGQYRPLVARSDGTVIIGSGTLAAARRLGLTELAVVRVDVDDEEAARMRLVDNRSAAIASYDDQELARLLEEFSDDPVGTGYEADELGQVLALISEPKDDGKVTLVKASCAPAGLSWTVPVAKGAFSAWESAVLDEVSFDEHDFQRCVLKRLEFDGVPVLT
jgi:hypothetical protein